MVDANFASAAAAYGRSPRTPATSLAGPAIGETRPPGKDFASLVADAAKGAVASGYKAESMTKLAIAGKAELADVVSAVSSAEVTLQTVVGVRDKMINAYQEILRMPI
jgi:flagellar hook-basal body complex protein FliE